MKLNNKKTKNYFLISHLKYIKNINKQKISERCSLKTEKIKNLLKVSSDNKEEQIKKLNNFV